MIHKISIRFLAVTGLFWLPFTTYADPPAAEQFKALSEMMHQTISQEMGDNVAGENVVALLSVGITAEPVTRPATPADEPTYFPYFNMRVFGGDTAKVSTADLSSTQSLARVYQSVLVDAKIPGLSAADEARLDELAQRISKVAPKSDLAFARYRADKSALQQQYAQHLLGYDDYQTGISNAQMTYDNDPDVRQYQKLTAESATITSQGPGFVWRLRQSLLQKGANNGYPVTFFPGYNDWESKCAWHNFDHKHSEVVTHVNHSSSGTSGDVSLWGVVPLASGGVSSASSLNDKFTKMTNISFDIARVIMNRYWLDETVFSDPSFTSKSGHPPLISTGAMNADGYYGTEVRPATGTYHDYLLPLIPNEVILIKNLKISFANDSDATEFASGVSSASGGVSLFGFRIGGSRSDQWDRTTTTIKRDGSSISCSGMTIIGYVCTKVPAFPAPTNLPQ